MSISEIIKAHEAKKKARVKIVESYLAASYKKPPHAHTF